MKCTKYQSDMLSSSWEKDIGKEIENSFRLLSLTLKLENNEKDGFSGVLGLFLNISFTYPFPRIKTNKQ